MKNQLFDEISKIVDLVDCDIKVDNDVIFVQIHVNEKTEIDGELNIAIKNLIENFFKQNDDYAQHIVRSIFLKSTREPKKTTKSSKSHKKIPNIKNIIVVASGKGGVGKSTIAGNLAISMSKMGWKVAILDADIYGASIPAIFSCDDEKISLNDDGLIIPIERHGIKINSIDFIAEKNEALVWRGPMISKVLNQLLKNTNWGEIDYLIIDTPPGTGDIHLTLLENYEIDGYLLVSTGHVTSVKNTKKTHEMFEKFHVKNLGLVMNMMHFDHEKDKKIFENDGLDILNCNNIFELPFFLYQKSSLFILKSEYEKFFIDIGRKIVGELIKND